MKNKEIKILLSAPRGFCAGVERAIEIVKKSINKYGAPVYVRHEIVHNKHVVDNLKKIGAIFIEELNEIKDKSRPVIFSAHGVPKSVPAEAEGYKEQVIARAEGAAQRFISIYDEYSNAKEVTKRRIYLETMEQILENTKKIIIDKNSGNGVVPYLPLPELKSRSDANTSNGGSR